MPKGVGPRLRGRAANPIRTGQWIKKRLGEVGSASITELRNDLKAEIVDLNQDRRDQGECAYRAPTYESFRKYFGNLRALGLVECIEEREMEFPPKGGGLLSIRKIDGKAVVVPSTIRVYALTARGKAEPIEGMWADPIKYQGQMQF